MLSSYAARLSSVALAIKNVRLYKRTFLHLKASYHLYPNFFKISTSYKSALTA
jgi:hypothetical protein